MDKPRVLMIGPGRDVKGGITTVVNSYFDCGLDRLVRLRYLATMEDGSKIKKLAVAAKAYASFGNALKDCDIVHIHMAAQASFDRKALFVERAHRAGKKILLHQHAADFDRYFFEQSNSRKRERIRRIFAMADRVIALSEEWAEFFGKNVCDAGKITVLHNGVVIPEYIKTDYSDRNVLTLGKLGERKGTYELLEAIPAVLDVFPDAVFYIAGDGDVARCRKKAAESGIEKNVVFTGWISADEREQYLKRCSTSILPSHHEGMPMSLLEAMSFGLAVIGTDVGGIPQLIDSGENGIMIKPGDTDGISSALIKTLRDSAVRQKLGAAAREKICVGFDLNGVISRLNGIYTEMTEEAAAL